MTVSRSRTDDFMKWLENVKIEYRHKIQKQMNTHYISTKKLTVSRISEIISNGDRLELSQEAATAVKKMP